MKKIILITCILFQTISLTVNAKSKDNRVYIHPATALTDTNVVLPPSWAFGMLYGSYTNQENSMKRVNEIISHNYPIDAYWIDSWFWSYGDKGKGPERFIDFVADTVDFPDRKKMWSYFEENNIKGGFWVWDCILQTGNEEAFDDFNKKGYFRNTYMEKGSWHNNSTTTAMYEKGSDKKGTLCGNINFDNPEATLYFKERMKHFFDEGADFVKLDRTSAINVCKPMFELSQEFGKETKGRGFILSHTGGMETEEYKNYPGKWTDDTRSDWNVEKPTKEFNSWVPNIAFKENIAMFTDPNNKSSKIPFLTNDLGGFDMGKTDKLDEELYIRWLQFSQFTPIVEVFSQPENITANMAYLISERADTIFRNYAHLRMELFPYIYSYAHQNRRTGEQMIRKIPGHLYDYLFGNEFLVAPVYEQGATSRKVSLPAGHWINYWTEKTYEGNKEYTVSAPIDQIPLFVRQGAIIPMRPYSQSIEKGTNDTLTLHLYPGATSGFNMIEDDGSSNDYLKGIYAMTTFSMKTTNKGLKLEISPVLGYYKGITPNRVWQICIHGDNNVSKITCNRKKLNFTTSGGKTVSEFFSTDKYEKNNI